ncbi:MAG: uroporphyrinogen decarboxylase family protein [Clostridiales bacterium]|nr:uroporphyrinogen decarboxylase family protein [Clostridiales bacterium]
MNKTMSSMERVLTALSFKEPDRVPMFLLLSLYGANEMKMTPKEYFSNPENVVEAQLKMLKKYDNDCLDSFYYAGIEFEAWGGKTIFKNDAPPVSGRPNIRSLEDIDNLKVPNVNESPSLLKVLKTIRMMKDKVGDQVPIVGVVMSPFSFPVIQMGFDRYLDLIYSDELRFNRLMKFNEEFCIEWANAQIDAGATVIAYFDPMSSPTIVPKELYLKTGYEISKRTISKINGPVTTHFASAITLPIIDEIIETGSVVVGVSCTEDLNKLKEKCNGKITILGNLNGIEMCRWTSDDTERIIKDLIRKAATGGGLIISDNHGEIPMQVPEQVLLDIATNIKKWGTYPLDWVDNDEQ